MHKDSSSHEAAPQEAAPQEAALQEAAPREAALQEVAPREVASQEASPSTAMQDADDLDAELQELLDTLPVLEPLGAQPKTVRRRLRCKTTAG